MKSSVTIFLASVIILNLWLWRSNQSLSFEADTLRELTALPKPAMEATGLVEHRVRRSLDSDSHPPAATTINTDQAIALLAQTASLSDEERAFQEEAMLMKLTETDPQGAAEVALARGAVPSLHVALRTWGERDPDAAWAWFLENDGQGRFGGKGALDLLAQSGSAVLEGIALTDLDQAFALIDSSGRVDALSRIAIAFEDHGQLESLKDRLNTLEESPLRQEGMKLLALIITLAGKADAIDLLETEFSEEDRSHFGGVVMNSVPIHLMGDPGRVATWLAANSEPSARQRNVIGFVSKWAQRDYNGVSAWLNGRREQPWYNEAVAEFVQQAVPADARSAIDWAATISDTNLRQQVLKEVISRWPESESISAEVYLSEQGIALEP